MDLKLKSNYNNYENRLQILTCKVATNCIFINIHGAFGESGDDGSKSQRLGKIICEKTAHVVHISTSRDWNLYASSPKNEQSEAFPNKTFDDESNDVKECIDHTLHLSEAYFGSSELELIVVANSLGGTIISSLVGKYQSIKKLVLCNSGIRSISNSHSIFTTVPSTDVIKQSTMKYVKELLFLQGELDEVVPIELQNELYESYINANKVKKTIQGANHNFSSIYGKNKDSANNAYLQAIIDFVDKSDSL